MVTKQKADAWRPSIWNAYVDLLAMEPYDELAEEQRPAHLVFWYESEVQNGGHLQYFENRGTEHLGETVEALGVLDASCQQQILREAGSYFLAASGRPSQASKSSLPPRGTESSRPLTVASTPALHLFKSSFRRTW